VPVNDAGTPEQYRDLVADLVDAPHDPSEGMLELSAAM